jgi:CHAT domain
MTPPVMVVATPGWMPVTKAREELKEFRFEVISSGSIYRLQSRDFRRGSAAVFVDKPSLGGDTVGVVSRLRRLLLAAKIVVLDEDPDVSDIVEVTLAGADAYVPTDQLADVILGKARWTRRVAEPADLVIRNYAKDALQDARRRPLVAPKESWTDLLLSTVTGVAETNKPLIVRARRPLERMLLDEFATSGVGYTPFTPELPDETGSPEPPEPPPLFWNTRFPEDLGILRNKPHVVAAGGEYLLQTVLEPYPDAAAESRPEQAGGLVDKLVRFRLQAQDGEFRALDDERSQGEPDWTDTAVSPLLPCTDAGTEPFEVWYRPVGPSPAVITAFLIVDNGTVDQCRFELVVVSGRRPGGASSVVPEPVTPAERSVGASVSHAQKPDYTLFITRTSAELWHENGPYLPVHRLPDELSNQVSAVATSVYARLRDASREFGPAGDPDSPLRLREPEAGMLELARAGAKLHHHLFRQPIRSIPEGLPAEWGELADCLRGLGSQDAPLLLQIHSSGDYPVPWGLLYDRYGDGAPHLSKASQVEPEGFWGRRFDIYRTVFASNMNPQRGGQRRVKPVIGRYVPGNQEQRHFVNRLRKDAGSGLAVDKTSLTVNDLKNWAREGTASDLMYLFCHARPARYDDASDAESWLGFGLSESDDSSEARAGIGELRKLWGEQRPTNPVVILNACSSAQQDLIYGAPFAEFFTEEWGAQAFIGTDWPVNSGFADVFGQRILSMILKDQISLRDALRRASDEAAQDSNYFPLMYAVHGLSTVRFVDPHPAG